MFKHTTMATWTIDPSHSEIGFAARHLVITKVRGHFGEYAGNVTSSDEALNDLSISFEANVASISTKNADRDNHLKSADFFDADNHPKLAFVSKSVRRNGNDRSGAERELRRGGQLCCRTPGGVDLPQLWCARGIRPNEDQQRRNGMPSRRGVGRSRGEL